MKIEYKSSIRCAAGWRSVYIQAEAAKISEKRCQVLDVIKIDDEEPTQAMSRTGANRQKYNGVYFADQEVGKTKNLSALTVLSD